MEARSEPIDLMLISGSVGGFRTECVVQQVIFNLGDAVVKILEHWCRHVDVFGTFANIGHASTVALVQPDYSKQKHEDEQCISHKHSRRPVYDAKLRREAGDRWLDSIADMTAEDLTHEGVGSTIATFRVESIATWAPEKPREKGSLRRRLVLHVSRRLVLRATRQPVYRATERIRTTADAVVG